MSISEVNDSQIIEDCEEDLKFLEINCNDWDKIKVSWEKTRYPRNTYLNSIENFNKLEDYIQKFPCLKEKAGFYLVINFCCIILLYKTIKYSLV
jgi:hypothetical protein